MTRPTISVIIPAFRAQATIAHTLRSVFGQSLPADEVIVVDDGSPDDTAALVARDFPSVRLLRQANAGPAAARNAGAAVARGQWLAFLDADDIWLPGKLERQMQKAADPRLGVIATRVAGRHGILFDPAPGFDALWEHNTIATSSVLVRRSAFLEAGGMLAGLPLCEDYHLWLRLCGAGWNIAICDEPLVVYARAPDSLTQQLERFADTERDCIEDIASRFAVPRDRMCRRVASGYRGHARGAIFLRDMKTARRLLWRSLRYRITVGQVIDLIAASAPRFLLDWRRWLLARGVRPDA